MKIFETYSKRQKGLPDVFNYEPIPQKFKNQVYHIWKDFFSQENIKKDLVNRGWKEIFSTICREEGEKHLYFDGFTSHGSPQYQVEGYFDEQKDTNKILDVIEVSLYYIMIIEKLVGKNNFIKIYYTHEDCVRDLNQRFKENGLGYELKNDRIIKIDNKLLHKEIIQPALFFTQNTDYKSVNEEFIKAHEHFRFNRYGECLNESLKAFESLLKIICAKNNWSYNESDTAKPLINKVLKQNFLPSYHESQLSALRQLFESSIPTLRNKNSGHGKGTQNLVIPEYLASYVLYMTGSTINFLIETQMDYEKLHSV